ncbi:sterol desaturase family protein [Chitinophaga nivalis]|uniref:Sterol desaturase family protein n=1 Tax=Chitinophaga nivalis TaxID=2991709 RepID=A0ABT3IQU5_9BACT|nr:sterol desaturase family protein [Chitinophaga nivalis]MCW3463979.1 sterol desaturase family protein [Chitinophaga nivalis]MCW3486331.1 sterol desaturase family protein [Chitinophaga nivalis]
MAILHTLYQELLSFLGIRPLITLFQTGNYQVLLTWDGISSAIGPLIPFLLLLEAGRALVYKRFRIEDYKMPFFTFVFNRFLSRFISIAAVAFCIGLLEPLALFHTTLTWYWLIYGYIIWEFAHFIYHYLGHKVRIFWCLHATHHVPQSMNLSVTYTHFFLEAPYADVIRTSICILAGIHPALLFLIMFIDGTWGAFIHVGENLLKDGRLGFLNRIILTPSHHRVHHARNPLYMDTNFCNLLNIWDKVFGTFQYEEKEIDIEYGVSREMNTNNFADVYFGELYYLFKDVIHAPGLKNKCLYFIMPPGWSHTGDHKTARVVKQAYLDAQMQALTETPVVATKTA